jgi:hypothetical protein
MVLKYHKTLSLEKWNSFPFSRQILMIANELNRAGVWIGKNDFQEAKLCYERALELLWLTISVLKDKKKLRELLRFRGIVAFSYLHVPTNITENKKMMKALSLFDKESYCLLNPSPKQVTVQVLQ